MKCPRCGTAVPDSETLCSRCRTVKEDGNYYIIYNKKNLK